MNVLDLIIYILLFLVLLFIFILQLVYLNVQLYDTYCLFNVVVAFGGTCNNPFQITILETEFIVSTNFTVNAHTENRYILQDQISKKTFHIVFDKSEFYEEDRNLIYVNIEKAKIKVSDTLQYLKLSDTRYLIKART